MATPRDKGSQAARDLRRKWGNTDLPIADLFGEIHSRLGIFVARKRLKLEVDGGIFALDGSALMVLNTADRNLGKQRVTAAHELGHYIESGGTEVLERIDDRSGKQSEAFAEGFAIELLAPEVGVRDWAAANASGQPGTRASHVAQLAAYYRTSYEMAAWRLRDSGHVSAADFTQLLAGGGRQAAFEGGVEAWYDENLKAMDLYLELPQSYLVRARSAYAESLITLDRLSELEFRPVEELRRRLKKQGMLHVEDEEESEGSTETRFPAGSEGEAAEDGGSLTTPT